LVSVTTHSLEPLRPWKQEQLGTGYRVSTWLEKSALEAADAVVAVSRDMRSDILRLFDLAEEKIHVIYNGIDVDEFKPLSTTGNLRKLGVDPEKPYLLFVGRITRQKGITHLMDAAAFIDPRVQVVLVAGQPDTEEIGAEVEGRIRKLQGERPHVVWIREWVVTTRGIAYPSLIRIPPRWVYQVWACTRSASVGWVLKTRLR
jgi:glycosyltransferase involved in cell wall biosynthesis